MTYRLTYRRWHGTPCTTVGLSAAALQVLVRVFKESFVAELASLRVVDEVGRPVWATLCARGELRISLEELAEALVRDRVEADWFSRAARRAAEASASSLERRQAFVQGDADAPIVLQLTKQQNPHPAA